MDSLKLYFAGFNGFGQIDTNGKIVDAFTGQKKNIFYALNIWFLNEFLILFMYRIEAGRVERLF